MKLGVTFPQLDMGADPGAIRTYTAAAADLGFDYLLAYDHVLGADPANRPGWEGYTHADSFHEPFTLFAFTAGIAPSLEFVPGVIILPQRQTVLVAKQAAELDVLTGGKFRLGIGVGWNPVEFEGLHERYDNRGRRIEEQIAVMRALWTQPLVTFEGEFHRIVEAGLNPLPNQRPIPIWIGGTADVVLERCGRLGDGWFPLGRPTAEVESQIAKLRAAAEAAGRPRDAIGIDARIDMRSVPEAEWGTELEHWQAAGATHISLSTMYQGFDVDAHVAAIGRFREVARQVTGR